MIATTEGQTEILVSRETLEEILTKLGTFEKEVAVLRAELSAVLNAGSSDSIEDDAASTRLSPAETTELLRRLESRFQTTRSYPSEGSTFENVKQILDADPNLAYRLYMAEEHLGATMFPTKIGEEIIFDDHALELDIDKQIAFLQNIPLQKKEAAVQILRKQYSNIPADAFDRSPEDKRGPSKWEGLLIEVVLGLESIPEKDYRAMQEQQRLDVKGISWLKASEQQLNSGYAPRGNRYGGDVYVVEGSAAYRDGIRGVRVRAKGSVVS